MKEILESLLAKTKTLDEVLAINGLAEQYAKIPLRYREIYGRALMGAQMNGPRSFKDLRIHQADYSSSTGGPDDYCYGVVFTTDRTLGAWIKNATSGQPARTPEELHALLARNVSDYCQQWRFLTAGVASVNLSARPQLGDPKFLDELYRRRFAELSGRKGDGTRRAQHSMFDLVLQELGKLLLPSRVDKHSWEYAIYTLFLRLLIELHRSAQEAGFVDATHDLVAKEGADAERVLKGLSTDPKEWKKSSTTYLRPMPGQPGRYEFFGIMAYYEQLEKIITTLSALRRTAQPPRV